MSEDELYCHACLSYINQFTTGEPYLNYNFLNLCYPCYVDIIPEIYDKAGKGDGGLIHLIFADCLKSSVNRIKRKIIPRYKEILESLLHKYNFTCSACRCTDVKKLTIDHIRPVSKGGRDDIDNLQILCRSCNSKKGAKWNI